jgi:hypothetical protein
LWIVEDGGRIGSIRAITKTTELTVNLPLTLSPYSPVQAQTWGGLLR